MFMMTNVYYNPVVKHILHLLFITIQTEGEQTISQYMQINWCII